MNLDLLTSKWILCRLQYVTRATLFPSCPSMWPSIPFFLRLFYLQMAIFKAPQSNKNFLRWLLKSFFCTSRSRLYGRIFKPLNSQYDYTDEVKIIKRNEMQNNRGAGTTGNGGGQMPHFYKWMDIGAPWGKQETDQNVLTTTKALTK